MSGSNLKSIRVNILGREIGLKVREDDEAHTRRIAQYVNKKMKNFQRAHPEQAELTTAIITSLALAEELYDLRAEQEDESHELATELDALADRLADALDENPADQPAPSPAEHGSA